MKLRSPFVLILSLGVVSMGFAQEEAPGPVVRLTTIEIPPASVQKWRGGLRALAEAAKAAELSAAELGWWAMNDGHRTMIIGLRDRDAVLRNRQLMEHIGSTNPEALQKIREGFEGTESRVIRDEIWSEVSDLSYGGEAEVELGGTNVFNMWIAPGKGEEFQEAWKTINELRAEAGYPYRVNVYRVLVGEPRFVAVTFYDNRSAYYGDNAFFRLAQAKGLEGLGTAFGALVGSLARYESGPLMNYAEGLSFPPSP